MANKETRKNERPNLKLKRVNDGYYLSRTFPRYGVERRFASGDPYWTILTDENGDGWYDTKWEAVWDLQELLMEEGN